MLAAVFVVCVVIIALKLYEAKRDKVAYDELRGLVQSQPSEQAVGDHTDPVVSEENEQQPIAGTPSSTEKPSEPLSEKPANIWPGYPERPASETNRQPMNSSEAIKQPEKKQILERFDPLLEKNSDTVGWLKVPGTSIDYPVVQGEDNDYYLERNFDKQHSSAGSIFMDYRGNIDPFYQNTVIYGHHMKNGTMFKDLVKFRNPDFLANHRTIYFTSLYEETEWEIFAVFDSDVSFDYIRPQYYKDVDFADFVKTLKSKAGLPDDWHLDKQQQILTLSTCSYVFNDARLVVQAKRVDPSSE